MQTLIKFIEGASYSLIMPDPIVSEYAVTVNVDMDNQDDIMVEIKNLESVHWTSLLPKILVTTVSTSPEPKRNSLTANT
jgi:hypothetical protein